MQREVITIDELARRLGYNVRTVRNKMALGVFTKGVHYASRPGLPVLFDWAAIVASYEWQGNEEKPLAKPGHTSPFSGLAADSVPMARGYLSR